MNYDMGVPPLAGDGLVLTGFEKSLLELQRASDIEYYDARLATLSRMMSVMSALQAKNITEKEVMPAID